MAAHSIDLQARKRMLLAESEMYRQTLSRDVAHLTSATAWISTTLHYARLVAPALAMAVPIAGSFSVHGRSARTRTRPAEEKSPRQSHRWLPLRPPGEPILDGFRRVRTPH